jgi:hypothetical protein
LSFTSPSSSRPTSLTSLQCAVRCHVRLLPPRYLLCVRVEAQVRAFCSSKRCQKSRHSPRVYQRFVLCHGYHPSCKVLVMRVRTSPKLLFTGFQCAVRNVPWRFSLHNDRTHFLPVLIPGATVPPFSACLSTTLLIACPGCDRPCLGGFAHYDSRHF